MELIRILGYIYIAKRSCDGEHISKNEARKKKQLLEYISSIWSHGVVGEHWIIWTELVGDESFVRINTVIPTVIIIAKFRVRI